MLKTLHITNGDSAADVIKRCGVEGEVLPWRDPMHHGPFPKDLAFDDVSRIRIGYLSGECQTPEESLLVSGSHGFSERDAMLAGYGNYDEVILWYEHDLLDQLQILQLLDWFAMNDVSEIKLSLICVDGFAGVENFRGIGQLSPEQMATLFSKRIPIETEHLELAAQWWSAFCSADPHALSGLIKSGKDKDDSALPFIHAALLRHCQEFPWTSDGLTRTERQLLSLVSADVSKPPRVFVDNMDFETCLFIGDWRTYSQIAELSQLEKPLLACVSGEPFSHARNSDMSAEAFAEQVLCLTDYGKRVLGGEDTALNSMPRNCWLGGVHLNSEKDMWLWDDAAAAFELARH